MHSKILFICNKYVCLKDMFAHVFVEAKHETYDMDIFPTLKKPGG